MDAIILMAGAGSRLGAAIPKPLVKIGGRPLISYTFDALERVGVSDVHIVVGAHNGLAAEVRALLQREMRFHVIVNPEPQKQNGVSVLCAAGKVSTPFFLMMGDHLFEPAIFEALLAEGDQSLVNLAIDRKIESIFDIDDAMKVQTERDRVVAIAKNLEDYDAIDTGAFLCSIDLFDYLNAARRNGDCSLADGVRAMAHDRKVRAVDIGEAWWQDVDTPEMLRRAEEESARLLRDSRRRLTEESVTG
ncbi:MAG: NTP transferase domain-containing protein [Chthoniobacterales bacterium]